MKRGKFIVLEGICGSGKSTEAKLLRRDLPKSVVFTREPGGTPALEKMRKMLLANKSPSPVADFLTFWAMRAEHVERVIEPALRTGRHVISDRFDGSTFAFQIYGEQQPKMRQLFNALREAVVTSKPDAYIVLDAKVDIAYSRIQKTPKGKERWAGQPKTYHARVAKGYRAFKPKGSRVIFVNADGKPDEVHAEVLKVVQRTLR